MDTNNTQANSFDPTSLGAKPVQGSFDPTTVGAKPYQGQTDINDSAALLGITNNVNEQHRTLLQSAGDVAGSAFNGAGEFAGHVATGVAKSAIDTAHGIGNLVGLKPSAFGQNLLNAAESTDQGTVGKSVGEAAGNIAQFVSLGGMEESAVAKAGGLVNRIKGLFGITGKAGKIVSGVGDVAARALATGASTGAVTAAQTGDLNQAQNAGVVGAVTGGLGQTLESFGSGISAALQKSGFKLTPMAEAKAATKAQNAAEFMANNKILGSSSNKFAKLDNINNQLENTLQNSLPQKLQINKDAIGSYINQSMDALKRSDPAVYTSAKNDVKDALNILKSKNPGSTSIDLGEALSSKRSYGKQAFKQSKIFDPKVVSEGSYAVEQAYQKAIEDVAGSTNVPIKVPDNLKQMFGGQSQVSLPQFNKVYSNAISAKNFTKIAQYKKDSGLFGRLFGLWAGEAAGQVVMPGLGGKIVGGAMGEVASTHLPSAMRNVSERVLASPRALPNTAKVLMGASRQAPSNNPEIQSQQTQ